ncbi:E-beta-farnesene synthase 1, partial [Tanacetum coccineum]
IFKNFIGEDGKFKESLCDDAQGMLALYEAAYMTTPSSSLKVTLTSKPRIRLVTLL